MKPEMKSIAKLKTRQAKDELRMYRRGGIKDSDMSFFIDAGGVEVIVVNKTGLMQLIKNSPLGPLGAMERLSNVRMTNLDRTKDEGPFKDFLTVEDECQILGI